MELINIFLAFNSLTKVEVSVGHTKSVEGDSADKKGIHPWFPFPRICQVWIPSLTINLASLILISSTASNVIQE